MPRPTDKSREAVIPAILALPGLGTLLGPRAADAFLAAGPQSLVRGAAALDPGRRGHLEEILAPVLPAAHGHGHHGALLLAGLLDFHGSPYRPELSIYRDLYRWKYGTYRFWKDLGWIDYRPVARCAYCGHFQKLRDEAKCRWPSARPAGICAAAGNMGVIPLPSLPIPLAHFTHPGPAAPQGSARALRPNQKDMPMRTRLIIAFGFAALVGRTLPTGRRVG